MTTQRPSAERPHFDLRRAVDLMFFAPIGLGAALVEDGPAAVRRARLELRNARFIGQLAVDRGLAELKRRIDESGDTRSSVEGAIEASVVEAATAPPTPDATASPAHGAVADLALPDYDTLPAIDIVDKLEHLTPSERSAIGDYERANRQRRTVLGKLDQLGEA